MFYALHFVKLSPVNKSKFENIKSQPYLNLSSHLRASGSLAMFQPSASSHRNTEKVKKDPQMPRSNYNILETKAKISRKHSEIPKK